MRRLTIALLIPIWVLGFGFRDFAVAQINMPDPSLIAGRGIPAPELPDGTVSVRVVREAIGNDIAGQDVTVTAGGVSRKGTTDQTGRAQMTGFPAGSEGTAETTVSGEHLVSLPFNVPATGGIRIILISGLKEATERRAKEQAAEAAAPPIKGTVVLGGDSRVMIEFRDDAITVFYVLEILNTARNRVDIGGPLTIDLPDDAQSVAVIEGSSPTATARGSHVTVTGPFAAGTTSVQVAFGLPHDSSTLTFQQKWPVPLQQVLVMAEKVGNLQVSSPQFTEHDESRAGNGVMYVLGGGQGLPAGGTLTLQLSGLPAQAAWPRQTALALAGFILVLGAWFAFAGRSKNPELERRLMERRDSLFGDLVKLEEQRRAGHVDGSRYATRRHRLLADLERIYGELDGLPTKRSGGGEAAA